MRGDLVVVMGIIFSAIYVCAFVIIWGFAATNYKEHWMAKWFATMVLFFKRFAR